MQCDVLVIGAGAAGFSAAWRAACLGAKTILLEKTERIGTKILISGGGKCNITHDGTVDEVLRGFRKNEALFLRPSLYRFPNTEIITMLEQRELEVYTRDDMRVFPKTGTAKDVVRVLAGYLADANVELRTCTPVLELVAESNQVLGARTQHDEIQASATVIATGGSSYPRSGTTGDAWRWTKSLGHTIVPIRPALAPVFLSDGAWRNLAGVSIRDCVVTARQQGKSIARWRGDALFTHKGISGPCALGISRDIAELRAKGSVSIEVDLCPSETFESLGRQILEWRARNLQRAVSVFVEARAPRAITAAILEAVGMASNRRACHMTKRETNLLIEQIKAWRIGDVVAVPLEKGECVAGGVTLSEVDPHSMASKVARNLYICGEALDVAGAIGGYNLQAAFSTGFVAGESAARSC